MQKYTAKKVLNKFKKECSAIKWAEKPFRHSLLANIRIIFGENSVQENGMWDYFDKSTITNRDVDIIKNYLNNFIIDVDNGAFNRDKNWLHGISNKQIIGAIIFSAMVGYVYGAYNNPNSAIIKWIKSLPFFIPE